MGLRVDFLLYLPVLNASSLSIRLKHIIVKVAFFSPNVCRVEEGMETGEVEEG